MSEEGSAPKSIAERIAALQKQQGHGAPKPKPQQRPNETSSRITDLQKTAEPAFFSSREKAMDERAKRGDSVDGAHEEGEDVEEKPKKAFKPPPGAVQVMLPQFAAKQQKESD